MTHDEFWSSTLRQIDERTRAYVKKRQQEIEDSYYQKAWMLSAIGNMMKGKEGEALTPNDFFDIEAFRKAAEDGFAKADGKDNEKKEQRESLAELEQSILGGS